jgi:hypothetical protein
MAKSKMSVRTEANPFFHRHINVARATMPASRLGPEADSERIPHFFEETPTKPTLVRKRILHLRVGLIFALFAHGRFRRAPKLWNVRTGKGAVIVAGERGNKLA